MPTTPFILDVDTGYDDALAILLAMRSPAARVLGITCVAGNHTVDQVLANTLKALDVCGAPPLPVAAGAREALIELSRPPSLLHGRDGMADLGLPASARQAAPMHAVELLRQLLSVAPEPVTLVACAPLTNIALFLRAYPDLRRKLGRVVIMGGAYLAQGNTSPLAEFNIRCDPEAAHIVLSSGLPIEIYPIDAFRAVSLSAGQVSDLLAAASPLAQTAGRIARYVMNHFGRDYLLIGDAGAMAFALDPSRATVQHFPVTVELSGIATRGQLVFDRRTEAQRGSLTEWWSTSPHSCGVVTDLDAAYYRDMFLAGMA